MRFSSDAPVSPLSSLTLQPGQKNKEKGDDTMDSHSLILSTAFVVMLLFLGLGLLLLRALKLPLSHKKITTLDQARQLLLLNDAFAALVMGVLWIAAPTIGRDTIFGGIIFLIVGVIYLIRGLRWKAGEKP
jgi:hypothetical protein